MYLEKEHVKYLQHKYNPLRIAKVFESDTKSIFSLTGGVLILRDISVKPRKIFEQIRFKNGKRNNRQIELRKIISSRYQEISKSQFDKLKLDIYRQS